MKILLGLGNPGVEYGLTRHNAGAMLVDYISEQLGSAYGWRRHYGALIYKSDEWVLVKSKEVFMNESGKLLQGLPEGELWVAHDDLDIRLGEYKVQLGKGPKVHGGINSIEAMRGKDFGRIRIGVDNRAENDRVLGEEYVLQKFSIEEKAILEKILEDIEREITKANN